MPSTTAVVSLFNPGDEVLANMAALIIQVEQVVVVDDGSPLPGESVLAALADMGCEVVRLTENSGIATALNAGVAAALAASPKPSFVLTMDQDSLLADGYVAALMAAAGAAEDAGIKIGMVAPASVRGLPVRRGPVSNGIQLGGEPIQSGLLVPAPVIESLGGFDDRLFIDGVDSEFYLRCQAAGYVSVLAPGASLDHSLGHKTPARMFGRGLNIGGQPLGVRTAATWRYYYIFRNRILIARDYGLKFPLWTLKGFLADYRHMAIVTVLAPGRIGRLSHALAGIADGLAGRSGKRPA